MRGLPPRLILSAAKREDPEELPTGLITELKAWPRRLRRLRCGLEFLGMTALNIGRSNVERWVFRLYSRVQNVACPIPDIDRSALSRFTAC
jgi:hypothetical protein